MKGKKKKIPLRVPKPLKQQMEEKLGKNTNAAFSRYLSGLAEKDITTAAMLRESSPTNEIQWENNVPIMKILPSKTEK